MIPVKAMGSSSINEMAGSFGERLKIILNYFIDDEREQQPTII